MYSINFLHYKVLKGDKKDISSVRVNNQYRIEFRELSQTKLASQIGISYKMLNHILNERRPLTPNTVMLFETALGIDADLLMRIQLKYNMRVAKQDKTFAKRLEEIR